MKKVDPKTLENFAKEKNIDKKKVEKIADSYKGKSESELMDELVKIGKNLKGKDEVVSKFKTFLEPEQQKKLDNIMTKISNAEVEEKVKKNTKNTKKTKNTNKNTNKSEKSKAEETDSSKTKKKVKKVKKVKKSSTSEDNN